MSTLAINAREIHGANVQKGHVEKHTEKEKIETSWFSDWLNDKDKVCTDGKDDGSISLGEGLESFGKGLLGMVKAAVNHPIATAATVGAGIGLTVLTGGAALPVMIAAGVGVGAVQIGNGAYKAATAKTDGEAKQAWESIGNGTFAIGASALGAKSSLNAASKAGVTTAEGAKDMSVARALVQNIKSVPEALKMSGLNIKGNIMTWTTGTVHAHSNALQGANKYMSKANDVQAYRFNPNGTPEEILANNHGVFRGADGKYYLPNKWSPNEPYLIDPSKEQMIMLYGGDDMEVCDGAIFKGSYVDTQAFKANGAQNYQNPSSLEYGKVVDVTKQAPGGFKVMPEGTKIKTLEGVRTVQKGEVVALDHAGNPYATTPANIVKRNEGLTATGLKDIAKVDKELAAKVEYRNMLKERILPEIPENLRGEASKLIDARAKAKVYENIDYQSNIHQGIIKSYNNTSAKSGVVLLELPKLGVKLDLLQARGIKVDIFETGTQIEHIRGINITENGVTHKFDYSHLADGYKWIDAKLAELAK